MALWIQAASLLVLLVLSPPSTDAEAHRHLCGADLVDALNLVCNRGKRDISPFRGFLSKAATGENEVAEFAFKDQKEMILKRQIVDVCCNSPCSLFVLQKYCQSLY